MEKHVVAQVAWCGTVHPALCLHLPATQALKRRQAGHARTVEQNGTTRPPAARQDHSVRLAYRALGTNHNAPHDLSRARYRPVPKLLRVKPEGRNIDRSLIAVQGVNMERSALIMELGTPVPVFQPARRRRRLMLLPAVVVTRERNMSPRTTPARAVRG